MGKTAKKIQKKQKLVESESEEEEVEVQEVKPKKGAPKSAFALTDVFSESFRTRLSQYITLNSEILTLKGNSEGLDQLDEIVKRKAQLADKVEGAVGGILKEELGTLEEWIREQQEKLSTDIITIEKAYQESKSTITGTGFFDESLVGKNLSFISDKQGEMQTAYENYAALFKCSQDIYN